MIETALNKLPRDAALAVFEELKTGKRVAEAEQLAKRAEVRTKVLADRLTEVERRLERAEKLLRASLESK